MTHILMTRMLMALHEVFLTRKLRILHFLPFQQHDVSFPLLFYSETTNFTNASGPPTQQLFFEINDGNLLGTRFSLGSV